MYRPPLLATALSIACLTPVHAQEVTSKDAFVEANILSIFYHELGHAIIDLMEVPIFGQEEDAADVMSVLLINWLFEEETAVSIAYDSAFGFINDPERTEEVQYWDLHGPDEQRYYSHVCIFYGANPEEREDLAQELGLPADRADWCPAEYEQAENSWGMIFDEMVDQAAGVPMVFAAGDGEGADMANRMLEAEVGNMNSVVKLPKELTVKVESCGDANAFYDPEDVSITFCTEFIAHLEDLFEKTAAN
jgi:hypothetical protein